MRNPESLLLPVMMFSDYFLTILSATWMERGYAKHFKLEHYELNPNLQQSVANKKWIHPKVFAAYILYSFVVIVGLELAELRDDFAHCILGMFIGLYAIIIGRHIGNLFTFDRVQRSPESLSGEVRMSHLLILRMSMHQYGGICLPLFLLAIIARQPWTLGFALGAALLLLIHIVWARKAIKTSPQSQSEAASRESDAPSTEQE